MNEQLETIKMPTKQEIDNKYFVEVGQIKKLKTKIEHDPKYRDSKKINIVYANKTYFIKVLDHTKLPDYGFIFKKTPKGERYYVYVTETKKPIYCDLDPIRRYSRLGSKDKTGRITFDTPAQNLSMEILYVLTAMLKDNVICFETIDKIDKTSEKIAKLEKEIAKLQEEKNKLLTGGND